MIAALSAEIELICYPSLVAAATREIKHFYEIETQGSIYG